jgi:hypothetical protein
MALPRRFQGKARAKREVETPGGSTEHEKARDEDLFGSQRSPERQIGARAGRDTNVEVLNAHGGATTTPRGQVFSGE